MSVGNILCLLEILPLPMQQNKKTDFMKYEGRTESHEQQFFVK